MLKFNQCFNFIFKKNMTKIRLKIEQCEHLKNEMAGLKKTSMR